MPTRDPSRPARRVGRLLVLLMGLVLAWPPAAGGQADYTGVPPTVLPTDAYVDTYAGPPAAGASTPARPPGPPSASRNGTVSVRDVAMAEEPGAEEAGGRLVTGWDLVTIAVLGLTAVVAFAVSAARLRSS